GNLPRHLGDGPGRLVAWPLVGEGHRPVERLLQVDVEQPVRQVRLIEFEVIADVRPQSCDVDDATSFSVHALYTPALRAWNTHSPSSWMGCALHVPSLPLQVTFFGGLTTFFGSLYGAVDHSAADWMCSPADSGRPVEYTGSPRQAYCS